MSITLVLDLAHTLMRQSKKPTLLFTGLRNAGKSSIISVVFERLHPENTLFIDPSPDTSFTTPILQYSAATIPSGPSHTLVAQLPSFIAVDALIIVLDSQAPSTFEVETIKKLSLMMYTAAQQNPQIQVEVFLHKVDSLTADYREETLVNLRDRLMEELYDLSPDLEASLSISYHYTSIFDPSVYHALSKIVPKLLPEQAVLERLLDSLCQQCSMDKAFLFDPSSKIYISTDSSPLDSATYSICAEFLDLVGDFAPLYDPQSRTRKEKPPLDSQFVSAPPTRPGSPILALSSVGGIHESNNGNVNRALEQSLVSALVKLNNGSCLAQWPITPEITLIALVRPGVWESRQSLIEYNVSTFKEAVIKVFQVNLEVAEVLQ